MSQTYNFSAGPATLDAAVLSRAHDDFRNWQFSGLSPLTMSHRSNEFLLISNRAEQDLREILNVPNNYFVLFLQGGATSQYAAIPMNLLRGKTTADYIHTGYWSGLALDEAKRYCNINVAANSRLTRFAKLPDRDTWKLNPNAAYVHYTSNETIHGVEFQYTPDVGDVPLVADMSSNILSRPIDVSKFGLIYAGAQKNLGPAGLTVVIVRDDLCGDVLPHTPSMLDYKVQADGGSMYNTPPTFAWYVTGLVLQWTKDRGGIKAMEEFSIAKSSKLYEFIDNSKLYHNHVVPEHRSRMNVTFVLNNMNLKDEFRSSAYERGLKALEGHPVLGGFRASIYNGMPMSGVDKLIAFMQGFEQQYA